MTKPLPFGRYLLLDRVSVGGMAEIFLAALPGGASGAVRAVKRLLPTVAEDPELAAMFLDEGRIAAQLDHPGIAAVHEFGKVGDTAFIAMDYVPGKDLHALLERLRARGERLPVPIAAHVGVRLCDALEYAHRKRDAEGRELHIVHCDVSPRNIILSFEGEVRLIDFGIAQAATSAPGRLALCGRTGYLSPERVQGLPVDGRADVFASGIVLYEMLAGERLFAGGSELAIRERIRGGELVPPSRRNAAVPPELDQLVARALARDVEHRISRASELRDGLAPWVVSAGAASLARLLASHFRDELRWVMACVAKAKRYARDASSIA